MSVTFAMDLPDPGRPFYEPCLCTQMSPKFSDWVQYGPGAAEEMRAEASPECHVCAGTGIEGGQTTALPTLNFSNDNALALLEALGLPRALHGEATLAQARRGVMRARARKSLQPFTRERVVAARFFEFGLSESALADRVGRFSHFVEAASSMGAKRLTWA